MDTELYATSQKEAEGGGFTAITPAGAARRGTAPSDTRTPASAWSATGPVTPKNQGARRRKLSHRSPGPRGGL